MFEKLCYLVIDYLMVIFVNCYICYQIMFDCVIYVWIVLVFGVKMDVVLGWLNEGWFLVEEIGVYYG